MNKDCIILHIPHSSTAIPKGFLHQYDAKFLQEEFLLMTDRYTDEIFNLPYTCVLFPYSRLFCDVERFRDDEKEEMSKKGMGVVYTKTHDGKIYRKVSAKEKNDILKNYYDAHHKKFEALVQEKLNAYGTVLIIDCHSFNPYPLPHEDDKSPRTNICLGSDDFHTDKKLLESFATQFENKNYSVKFNSPFSGTIVPLKFYHKNKNVKSIMIELKRELYMDVHGEKTDGFCKLKNDVAQVIASFVEEV